MHVSVSLNCALLVHMKAEFILLHHIVGQSLRIERIKYPARMLIALYTLCMKLNVKCWALLINVLFLSVSNSLIQNKCSPYIINQINFITLCRQCHLTHTKRLIKFHSRKMDPQTSTVSHRCFTHHHYTKYAIVYPLYFHYIPNTLSPRCFIQQMHYAENTLVYLLPFPVCQWGSKWRRATSTMRLGTPQLTRQYFFQ